MSSSVTYSSDFGRKVLETVSMPVKDSAQPRIITVSSDASIGGTLRIIASDKAAPSLSTATDWFVVDGLSDLTAGQLYAMQGLGRNWTVAVEMTSSGSATITLD